MIEYICQGLAFTDGMEDGPSCELIELTRESVRQEAIEEAMRLLKENHYFCGTITEATGRDSHNEGVMVKATLTDYGDIIGRLNEGITNIEKIPGTSKTTKIVKEMVLGVLKKIRGDEE
jgi:hypothetical protein